MNPTGSSMLRHISLLTMKLPRSTGFVLLLIVEPGRHSAQGQQTEALRWCSGSPW